MTASYGRVGKGDEKRKWFLEGEKKGSGHFGKNNNVRIGTEKVMMRILKETVRVSSSY